MKRFGQIIQMTVKIALQQGQTAQMIGQTVLRTFSVWKTGIKVCSLVYTGT